MKPLCESSNIWKLVKLKSSISSKFSKARLKFIIVIVKSKTEIVQSIKVVQSGLELMVKLFQSSFFFLKVPRLFLCKFSKELYFWANTFEIYHIIFLVFYQHKQPSEVFCKKNLKNYSIFTRKCLCWSFWLITLQALRLQTWNFIKRDSNTVVFLWILRYS